jgi:hypothetical protein
VVLANKWRLEYNNEKRHSAPGYGTPRLRDERNRTQLHLHPEGM